MENFLKCKFLKVVFNLFYFVLFFLIIELITPNSWHELTTKTFGDYVVNYLTSFTIIYLQLGVGMYLWNNTKKAFNPTISRARSSKGYCWAWMWWC